MPLKSAPYSHPGPVNTLNLQCFQGLLPFTKKIIFGFAMGSNMIAFRLNPLFKGRALETGGSDLSEPGPDWVSFVPFRDDWPEIDFKFWARKAYLCARS